MSKRMTSIRLTGEDDSILKSLARLTGLGSNSDIFRIAIREALAARLAVKKAGRDDQ